MWRAARSQCRSRSPLSWSFEDAVRTAVSLGGDTDTIGCIAGSMAEAMYGVPEDLKKECRARLPEDMLEMLSRFDGLTAK